MKLRHIPSLAKGISKGLKMKLHDIFGAELSGMV